MDATGATAWLTEPLGIMAVQRVSSELVSAEFPVKQGRYREFFNIDACFANANPVRHWFLDNILTNSLNRRTGNLQSRNTKIFKRTGKLNHVSGKADVCILAILAPFHRTASLPVS